MSICILQYKGPENLSLAECTDFLPNTLYAFHRSRWDNRPHECRGIWTYDCKRFDLCEIERKSFIVIFQKPIASWAAFRARALCSWNLWYFHQSDVGIRMIGIIRISNFHTKHIRCSSPDGSFQRVFHFELFSKSSEANSFRVLNRFLRWLERSGFKLSRQQQGVHDTSHPYRRHHS